MLAMLYEIVEHSEYSTLLWCNARVVAIPFYIADGWKIVSDVFEIQTVGPHVIMTRESV